MPNSTTTQGKSQLTADEAKASLGTATLLQSFLLPKGQASQDAQNAPGQAQSPETAKEKEPPQEEKDPMKEMELMFTTKLDEIRQELKKDNQREIDTLKETITNALAEDEPNKA